MIEMSEIYISRAPFGTKKLWVEIIEKKPNVLGYIIFTAQKRKSPAPGHICDPDNFYNFLRKPYSNEILWLLMKLQ